VALFVDWYNHRHRHSGIKFVTPQQHHSGQAVETCRHRGVVYEDARQCNPGDGHDRFSVASTRGGLDQSTASRNRIHTSYFDDHRLNSSRGDIFPGRYRIGIQSSGVKLIAELQIEKSAFRRSGRPTK